MQEQLDQECIDMLPLVKAEIEKTESRIELSAPIGRYRTDAICMRHVALIEAVNSRKPIIDMTPEELEEFQRNLLKMFKRHGWIK